ncbi:hypothetical protein ACFQ4H_19140 [Micromonospora sonneratiae]|uniref:Uncharacterized protein n=2 Tax=Micromonospora sonneratiae TaxID=1184706 RepID=A0ABW3YFH4_9ACTN
MFLGEVTCPSGELVLMDGGYLELWSGDRSPDEVDGTKDLPACDFEIVGPDAEAAARSFGRQSGRMLYDIPHHGTDEFWRLFDQHCREHTYDASLCPFPRRISHRDRVRRAITDGDPDFLITGVPVVPVGGVPTDRPLAVTVVRGEWGWSQVRIGLREDVAVATRRLGSIGVDYARFVFADADALGSWVHNYPVDGLADVVFWGRDEEQVAAEFGAQRTGTPGDDSYGWLNLPVRDAYARAVALNDRKNATPDRKFAFDFRPHSHHWQVMASVRASENEAATIEIGGAQIMMAMTSVGDGFFPVDLDVNAAGAPVAVRITVAGDE